jgi:8-oxo-dGTP pyrophosphatase MutT (NUDIX family)
VAGLALGHPCRVLGTLAGMEDRFRQQVPRPSWARTGPRALWQDAGPLPHTLAGVREALRDHLPDETPPPATSPTAAVLVPLFDLGGEPAVLLIRRAMGLGQNPGEVAFPGGHLEAGESGEAAALREAEEEVGLPPSSVEVLGQLPVRNRARSPGAIIPVVGIVAELPDLTLNPLEVDEILHVPLPALVADGVYWEEVWTPEGAKELALAFFAGAPALGDDLVWGATARMLSDLFDAVVR